MSNDVLTGKEAVVRSAGKGGKTAMVTVVANGGQSTRHLKLISDKVEGRWRLPKYTDSEGRIYIGFVPKDKTDLIGEKLDVCPLPVAVAKK